MEIIKKRDEKIWHKWRYKRNDVKYEKLGKAWNSITIIFEEYATNANKKRGELKNGKNALIKIKEIRIIWKQLYFLKKTGTIWNIEIFESKKISLRKNKVEIH